MPTLLRALIVEDNERDAALLIRELRRANEVTFKRVETAEDMRAALKGQAWDIVISDFSLPMFSAAAALSVLKESGLDLPFIIVSGTIGEETAVEAMRAGAHDFIPKDAVARLLPAIERELREADVRRERMKMREHLLISERMASVGMLAASVAHEINNPLTVVVANLELIAQSLSQLLDGAPAPAGANTPDASSAPRKLPLSKVAQTLRDAQEAAERVRQIARDLRIFSRSSDEERHGPVNVCQVLDSSIRMASNEVRHRARLITNYGDVPHVEANEARLGQVFLNLIVNAAQAIPEGRANENEIRITTRVDDLGRVVAEVADTGSGIPLEMQPRIFGAFFTTKPAGIGTGLGLPICHRIVTALGGEISFTSEAGKGTVFRVALPQAASAPAVPMKAAPQAREAGRRGRVLVVDDEPMLCSTIKMILGDEHDVVTVTSAKMALALIEQGERFDLVLSDIMMPQVTGMDLYAELSRRLPDHAQKMIFMTGGAFSEEAASFLQKVSNPSIEKPFTAKSLRRFLRTMLA